KEGEGNYLECVTTQPEPVLHVQSGKGQQVRSAKFKLAKVTEVMGWKTVGAKLLEYSPGVEMEWVEQDHHPTQQELF
ncbi:MAG TPA: hypothetical protein PLS00_06675, partial [Niabella sp.]|nr:hypothetical protein [Niabella sp.]